MPQCQRNRVSTGRYPDNEQINKYSVALQTLTLHQSSNIARFYVVQLDKYLVNIDQLYQFMKIINLSRVGIPPPEK